MRGQENGRQWELGLGSTWGFVTQLAEIQRSEEAGRSLCMVSPLHTNEFCSESAFVSPICLYVQQS